jgi:D-threonate/D-erythronate kinase
MRAGVVADDLTGALEMGALLAARGLRCLVCFGDLPAECDADAVAIDTESRHLPPEEAAVRVLHAVDWLRRWGASRLFKKIDSTLRGPVDAEVRAFAGDAPLVFTPAYPAMGRVVRDGKLYVHGAAEGASALPMEDAADESSLRDLVERQPDAAFAGSGGLGRAWAASLPQRSARAPHLPAPRRVLVVCGSRHPASREQAARARSTGVHVLTTPEASMDPAEAAESIAEEAVRLERPDLLIAFGGDTAYCVLRRLGLSSVIPVREVLPGIPLSTAEGLAIVTKAGGFGTPDIVERILKELR